MTQKEKAEIVIKYMDEILPDAKCQLVASKDYEFLICVMLSAQTTDTSVNKVTPTLFKHYPTLQDLKNAKEEDIKKDIQTLGLASTKAKNIKTIATKLVDEFDGILPREKSLLVTLPGVGNKTANVVRAEIFNEQEFAVDTHVSRIAKRLSFAKKDDDVLVIETKLRKAFPSNRYTKSHHQLIWFGRLYCKAQSPKCEGCKLHEICSYYKTKK